MTSPMNHVKIRYVIECLVDDPMLTVERLLTLEAVDWTRGSLLILRRRIIEQILKILANKRAFSPLHWKLAVGKSIHILAVIPKPVLEEYFTERHQRFADIAFLLDAILESLEDCYDFFPNEDRPMAAASSMTTRILLPLYTRRESLFNSKENMRSLVIVCLKLWCWGGELFGEAHIPGLQWDPVGWVGLEFMETLLGHDAAREAVIQICEEGVGGWDFFLGWLIIRAQMMVVEKGIAFRNVQGLIGIVHSLSLTSPTFAELFINGKLPSVCVAILRKSFKRNDEYVKTTTLFMYGIQEMMNRFGQLRAPRAMKRLLRSGILWVAREATLNSNPTCCEELVEHSWDFVVEVIKSLLNLQIVPTMGKAIRELPVPDEVRRDPCSCDTWRLLTTTAAAFANGLEQYRKRLKPKICDNLLCNRRSTNVKKCAGCEEVRFCDVVCQRQAWTQFHRSDCRDYRNDIISKGFLQHHRKLFFIHVLSVLLNGLGIERSALTGNMKGRHPETTSADGHDFPFFVVEAVSIEYTTCSIVDLRRDISSSVSRVPLAFLHMMDLIQRRHNLIFTGMTLVDGEDKRIYVFGLFEKEGSGDQMWYRPCKAIEVRGLPDLYEREPSPVVDESHSNLA